MPKKTPDGKIKKKEDYTKTDWIGWLWPIFSRYIRTRDCIKTTGSPLCGVCITCGLKYPFKKLQAGHFIPGRTDAVLFDTVQVHAQCYRCNKLRQGMWHTYYLFMLGEGHTPEDIVTMILQRNDPVEFSREWFNLLYFPNTYYKAPRRPDTQLRTKLLTEVPGILNWALCGWISLQEGIRNPNPNDDGINCNGFTSPLISESQIAEYKELAQPLKNFVDEFCVFDDQSKGSIEAQQAAVLPVRMLYELYKIVFHDWGMKPDNLTWFGRKLNSAFPELKKVQRGTGTARECVYVGLGLTEAGKNML